MSCSLTYLIQSDQVNLTVTQGLFGKKRLFGLNTLKKEEEEGAENKIKIKELLLLVFFILDLAIFTPMKYSPTPNII